MAIFYDEKGRQLNKGHSLADFREQMARIAQLSEADIDEYVRRLTRAMKRAKTRAEKRARRGRGGDISRSSRSFHWPISKVQRLILEA